MDFNQDFTQEHLKAAKYILKNISLKGYMNPQPAPTHEGSTIENITRYIKDTEKEGQLAGRTIVSDWEVITV